VLHSTYMRSQPGAGSDFSQLTRTAHGFGPREIVKDRLGQRQGLGRELAGEEKGFDQQIAQAAVFEHQRLSAWTELVVREVESGNAPAQANLCFANSSEIQLQRSRRQMSGRCGSAATAVAKTRVRQNHREPTWKVTP
jgi:hypothetical protein